MSPSSHGPTNTHTDVPRRAAWAGGNSITPRSHLHAGYEPKLVLQPHDRARRGKQRRRVAVERAVGKGVSQLQGQHVVVQGDDVKGQLPLGWWWRGVAGGP